MTNRTRNLSIIGIVLGPARRRGLRDRDEVDEARPRPPGRSRARLPGAADAPGSRGHASRRSTTRSRRSASAPTPSACRSPRSSAPGRDQISIGLPAVQNAERAIQQVGSTAQLQFYDWEPNVLGNRGPDMPYAGSKALYDAAEFAQKQKPKAEKIDVPPGSDLTPAAGGQAERQLQRRRATTCSGRTATRSAPTASRSTRATTTRRRAARACWRTTSPQSGPPQQVREGHRVPVRSSRRSARAARRRARRCSRSRAAS